MEKIAVAKAECERFLARLAERDALKWETTHHAATDWNGEKYPAWSSKYAAGEGQVNGAIKRASLDLSRALASLRRA